MYQPQNALKAMRTSFGAVDAWGLGCVLFEMATSRLPTDPPFLGQLRLRMIVRSTLERSPTNFLALAAAEHAAAQARDDDADSKASRSLCVAGLSSLLDGLLSAAPSESRS